jgi:hypothetical protein
MLALYLQHARHYTPLAVGLAFVPFAGVLGVANVVAGSLVGKRGPRAPMLAWLSLSLLGFALLFVYQKATQCSQPYGVSRRWLVVKCRIAPQGDLSFLVLNWYIEQAWIRWSARPYIACIRRPLSRRRF